jgi:hypothetical protein
MSGREIAGRLRTSATACQCAAVRHSMSDDVRQNCLAYAMPVVAALFLRAGVRNGVRLRKMTYVKRLRLAYVTTRLTYVLAYGVAYAKEGIGVRLEYGE